ncbi:MAG: hypothetical protein J2P17_15985, partial [Mycobacterium sp.]|nr:hypothetical protein [Mycobacterium sp.]
MLGILDGLRAQIRPGASGGGRRPGVWPGRLLAPAAMPGRRSGRGVAALVRRVAFVVAGFIVLVAGFGLLPARP